MPLKGDFKNEENEEDTLTSWIWARLGTSRAWRAV